MSTSTSLFENIARPDLPLVSIVIINYNNSDYLRSCLYSVLSQTYRHIECIIVDDCSTDNSLETIELIKNSYENIKIITNSKEQFQTFCGHEGFHVSKGEYIIFLDADDYLLEECVETHIYAHLSSIDAIGFTTCDSLQVAGNNIVRANYTFFSRYVMEQQRSGAAEAVLKPINEYAADIWRYNSVTCQNLAKNVAMVNHNHDNILHQIFPVTATSTNCFRRDAIEFFLSSAPASAMRETKGSLDCYLICGIWFFSASLVINYPLVGRRIHGGSICGSSGVRAELMGFGVALDKVLGEAQAKVFIALSERIIGNAREILRQIPSEAYPAVVKRLDAFIKLWYSHNIYTRNILKSDKIVLDLLKRHSEEMTLILGGKYDELLDILDCDKIETAACLDSVSDLDISYGLRTPRKQLILYYLRLKYCIFYLNKRRRIHYARKLRIYSAPGA